MAYYSSLIVLTWLALFILCILVRENARLSEKDKRILYLTYSVVMLASLFEWMGVFFKGKDVPSWLIMAVKFFDYALTPFAGGVVILQFHSRSARKKVLFVLLGANMVFQLVSVFTGWMTVIDEHNVYAPGPFYPLYMALYVTVTALVIVEFAAYGKKFSKQNRLSLYAILFFVVAGTLLQDVSGERIRISYLSIAVGLILMFIHFSEFSQLEADERLREQMILITVDPLTGVSSRYAYAKALRELDRAGPVPSDLVVFSFDINGLKPANDTLGHVAGDELICAAAGCIVSALSEYGVCYRTGGDEFIVLATLSPEEIPDVLTRLYATIEEWQGQKAPDLRLSVGYAAAADHPGLPIERLITEADREMYKAKADYYRIEGIDRRRY